MSNQAVGNVYQSIIEEVINSSRVDFEESGVDESVLDELRLVRIPHRMSSSYILNPVCSHQIPLATR